MKFKESYGSALVDEGKTLWILRRKRDGSWVPPKEGLMGYEKKDISEALRDFREEYPRSEFGAFRQAFVGPVEIK